jgi:transcriptional regulator with XRE-family HTH domain
MAKRATKKAVAGEHKVIAPYDPELGIDAQLRAALRDSKQSRYAIAQASGISQSILSRFSSGERGLTAETAERLAVALGLRLALVTPSAAAFGWLLTEFVTALSPQPQELVRRAMIELTRVSPMKPYVSMADLRAKLQDGGWLSKSHSEPPSRSEVDAAIIEWRREGTLSLSVAESRHAMTAAERDACLEIDGRPHSLVSFTSKIRGES